MITIVGNILKDVYLNLDSRTEAFETDKNNVKWLDLAFNTSEHHFFSREASLGGAAISLEVLSKIGLSANIAGSNLRFENNELTLNGPAETYRYILITDEGASYFTPTNHQPTNFTPPAEAAGYLYIDRSAHLTAEAATKILTYLDLANNTKLILYVQNTDNPHLIELLPRADLIFTESETLDADPQKLIYLSDTKLSYQNITEPISIERIDMLTHLSIYSIAAATILGSFILGHSVENSLRLARVNLEHAKLNSTLPLDELQDLAKNISDDNNLELIAKNLVLSPKGILAADESGGSIHKKFDQLDISDTYDTRRDYRNLFFTTNGLENYVNGIILFDETARQHADNGQTFTEYLISKRIIPGIKVDQGLANFDNSDETYTKGLDDLSSRLKEYYQMGLRFAKWRAAFEIRLDDEGNILTPTPQAINENCEILAKYAKECQTAGLVPIVEPEVVYDGSYDIDKSSEVTGKILDTLFQTLKDHDINLKACILKCNMILAGKQYNEQSTPDEVGSKTAETLIAHVPEELAGIVFLSGGQTPEQATENLSAVIKKGPFPWPITFSFARALQDPALYAWAGDNQNAEAARQAFLDRLIANQEALS